MISLADKIVSEACRMVLTSPDKEVKRMFNKDDAHILRKVAAKIEKAYKKDGKRR